MKQQTYKLVLDVLDDGRWNIDVRKLAARKLSIGHIILSPTGITWKDPNKRDCRRREIVWADIANVFETNV